MIWPIEPIEAADKRPKIFLILVSNSSRYTTFWAFYVFLVYIYRSIPRILRIRTDSFPVFSVYKQIHSTYSQYMYRFIPCIQRMRPNNFEYIGWNYFLYSFERDTTSKKYVCMQLDQRPVSNNQLFGPSLTIIFLLAYSDIMGNDIWILISRRIWIYVQK